MDKANTMGNCYKSNGPRKTQDELRKSTEEGHLLLNLQQARTLFQGLPASKRTRKFVIRYLRKLSKVYSGREVMKEDYNLKPEDLAAEETKEEQSISSSIDVVHNENVKPGENYVWNQIHCNVE